MKMGWIAWVAVASGVGLVVAVGVGFGLVAVCGRFEREVGPRLEPLGSESAIVELLRAQLVETVPGGDVQVYVRPEGEVGIWRAEAGSLVVEEGPAPSVVRRAMARRRLEYARPDELLALSGSAAAAGVAVPVLFGGGAWGAFLIVAGDAAPLPEPRQLARFAEVAAAMLGLEARAVACAQEARRDPLTGLCNRRAFEEALVERLADTAERGPLALALLDLDEFKRVNDAGGHPAGDELLRRVAQAATGVSRAGERLFRVGGDELALLLDGDATAAAVAVARLREVIAALEPVAGRSPTVSAGIASYPAEAGDGDELVRHADAALYAAKIAGRDRAIVYGEAAASRAHWSPEAAARLRVLVVDDDHGLRTLLRTTLELGEMAVDEAEDAAQAAAKLTVSTPDLIVLDIGMPGTDGLTFCRQLKSEPRTGAIPVVLLSGLGEEAERQADEVGAAAFLRKPFSPLELSALIAELTGRVRLPLAQPSAPSPQTQLLAYASDFRRLLDLGLRQQSLLETAYRQTVAVLAGALERKDVGTAEHSHRVLAYASELALAVSPVLLDDPSLEYGFLLHDLGKIAVPDRILQKPGPLTGAERELVEQHPLLGAELLDGVALLAGEGIRVVRSHHERWDGRGYPDRLRGDEIPLGARVFAVADSLDAMTSNRPYRAPIAWEEAVDEIKEQAGRQFDPEVVAAFSAVEERLHQARTRVAV
jgi:diguanylate cyclase (GGDEF)-like protein